MEAEKVKVFLVDDEAIILQGLEKTYAWDKMGATVIGTNRNPNEAVKQILETNPDIIITDVRMKQMSGLELIQTVQRNSAKKYIWIVISAYRDFEYAQQACELGAFTYLLKPIEDEKLEKVVRQAAERIKQERKKQKIVAGYEHFIETNRKVFENYMVGKISREQLQEDELYETLERFGDIEWDKLFYRAICIDFLKQVENVSGKEGTMKAIVTFMEKNMEEVCSCFYFQNEDGNIIVILASEDEQALVVPVIKRKLNRIQQEFQTELLYEISDVYQTISGLKQAYAQAVEVFEQKEETNRDEEELERICTQAGNYINKAMDYIQDHLDDEFLSVSTTARELHLNAVYFGRLFRQGMQRSFKQYILEERVRLAKKLLKTTDDTISQIGEKVGMPNPSYFTQQFKKSVGQLPTEYRKQYNEK